MPPKKRKAAAAPALPTRQKRVRIGSSSVIGEDDASVSASGRPKRSTVGEPNYDQTRHRSDTPVKQSLKGNIKRRPGLSAPASSAPIKKPVGRPSKIAIHVEIPPKKRGRPPGKVTKAKSPSKQATGIHSKSTRTGGRPARSTSKAEAISVPPGDSTGAVVEEAEREQSEEEEMEEERQFWLMKAEPDSRIENGHEMKFSVCHAQGEVFDRYANMVLRSTTSWPNAHSLRVGTVSNNTIA
jgi:hypothetical protein